MPHLQRRPLPQPTRAGIGLRLLGLIALSPAVALALDPVALPEGGRVLAGTASVTSEGRTMTVTQGSRRAILEWQRFDIGSDATVRFQQPSSSSVALNRIVGGDASRILGSLSANGHVYLVNGAGVLFGRGAQVDVGGLVTSTLDVADGDFLAGRERFEPSADLTALDPSGIGRDAQSTQQLQASTAIGQADPGEREQPGTDAPRQLTMDAGADGHLRFGLAPDEIQALLDGGGLVQDEDGLVLTAQGASALAAAVVAHDGAPQARIATRRDGRLLLLASEQTDSAQLQAAPGRGTGHRTALRRDGEDRPLLRD